ncbi:hypothetical protein FEM48_Zijuj07G0027100 [Ziziphus jujuba var. spinosa]|uniref:Uncharacterized protein n=1 Tax=Ziziphus jujuba var. spinosa TaxID=714518 RepID=A0A978V1Z8_ZIZJJ|nr:hypothetical protein FEM48_Zijuj07G0027100 [Ziziphus jujuba var. spinosa]
MAVSVFDNPITNSTLERTPEFTGKKNIQKIDRACAALTIINSDVNFVTHHDWVGENGLPLYPTVIENGQSGGYLHVTKSSVIIPPGKVRVSAGAVVYRGVDCDVLLAWNNPSDSSLKKTAVLRFKNVVTLERSTGK